MDITSIFFYTFSAVLLFAALKVITSRNPVHSALYLVLCFFQASAIWMLLQAEFLSISLILVYVGAVMVLFLFVVMMLDVNIEAMRKGLLVTFSFSCVYRCGTRFGVGICAVGRLSTDTSPQSLPPCLMVNSSTNTKALGLVLYSEYLYPLEIAAVILLVAIVAAIALTLRDRKAAKHKTHLTKSVSKHPIGYNWSKWPLYVNPWLLHLRGESTMMVTLGHYLTLGAILFALSVMGIFLNRKNLIVLLMAIELMLLAVNINFVAFSHYLGDIHGQIFVFFYLTVAAAESAIGLAILVLVFRNRATVQVDELNALKG
jgi:NADH-quinone oxidoreductase subunit J